jgi:outer membrane protein assembly factor BamB
VLAKVGQTGLLVTPGGDVVRLGDGKVVACKLGGLEFCAPVSDGDTVYFAAREARAVKLSEAPDGTVSAATLWKVNVPVAKGDRHYASPLLAGGLLYVVSQDAMLAVLDAATGRVVYAKQVPELARTTVYSSPCAAGKYVFLAGESGVTAVIEAGREYRPVARNQLDGTRSCPVFAGPRMYLRTMKAVYCLGR